MLKVAFEETQQVADIFSSTSLANLKNTSACDEAPPSVHEELALCMLSWALRATVQRQLYEKKRRCTYQPMSTVRTPYTLEIGPVAGVSRVQMEKQARRAHRWWIHKLG